MEKILTGMDAGFCDLFSDLSSVTACACVFGFDKCLPSRGKAELDLACFLVSSGASVRPGMLGRGFPKLPLNVKSSVRLRSV